MVCGLLALKVIHITHYTEIYENTSFFSQLIWESGVYYFKGDEEESVSKFTFKRVMSTYNAIKSSNPVVLD